jgi:hypothetical protein
MITHVAIRLDGEVYSLPRPNRHSDVIKKMVELGLPTPISCRDSGFLINGRTYVNRKEAVRIAIGSGEVKNLISPPDLYSEDLW